MNTILEYDKWAEKYETELNAIEELSQDTDFLINQYEDYLKTECFYCNFYKTSVCRDCPAEGVMVDFNTLARNPIKTSQEDVSDIPF